MKIAFKNLYFIVHVLLFVSCSAGRHGFTNKKISAEESKKDIIFLKSVLELNHPSLYWYTSKDSVDNLFNSAITSINDSLSEPQLKNKIAWVVSKLRCGHTAVRYSKTYTRYYLKDRKQQFPLALKVWDDSIVVINNAIKNNTGLKRGTVITSINGYSNRKLLDSMFALISTDGYSDNFKEQIVSFNFPFYYANTFGVDSVYRVSYIDASGEHKIAFLKGYTNRRDTAASYARDSLPTLTKKEFRNFRASAKRSLQVDSSLRTAILRLNTFSDGNLRLFFRKSFKKIRKDSIRNLVIDIRENGGGDIMSSTRLTQYLINRPFRVADTVAAINRSLRGHRHIHPWFIYWLTMHLTGRKQADDRIHFKYFERHVFKPKKVNHFSGEIYIVTGGYSFSAATLFAGTLKGQKNITLVGEETGGGFYGNTAMHLPVIHLPNSHIRVVLPLYRIVVDRNRPKTGRGIFPDVDVQPSSFAIRRGVDIKMEKVKDLIIKNGVDMLSNAAKQSH